jgi:hypothetical protein
MTSATLTASMPFLRNRRDALSTILRRVSAASSRDRLIQSRSISFRKLRSNIPAGKKLRSLASMPAFFPVG